MIIETTTLDNQAFAFNDRNIFGVSKQKDTNLALIYFYGVDSPVLIDMIYIEVLKIFKDAQSRDYFSDSNPRKSEQKKFDSVIVGAHKFKIDIRTTEYEDGASSVLQLYTNFELKSEDIKNVIKSVEGVDSSMTYLTDRYEISISIGKMFDAEWVRQNLENTLIMYLQS